MKNIFAAGRFGFEYDGKQAFERDFFIQQLAYGLGFCFAEVVGLGKGSYCFGETGLPRQTRRLRPCRRQNHPATKTCPRGRTGG